MNVKKKKYEFPELEIVELTFTDVIRTSGLDAPVEDDPFGEWEI